MSGRGYNQSQKPNPNRLTKWQMTDFGYTSYRSFSSSDQLSKVGYQERPSISTEVAASHTDEKLVVKRSWDIALSPLKQVPQNLFLMWMSGNTISIFPIMMVGMLCMRPLQSLFSIQTMFAQFQTGGPALLQKLVYLLGLLCNLALAMYKCSSMGLLPLHQSDWIGFMVTQAPVEFSQGSSINFS